MKTPAQELALKHLYRRQRQFFEDAKARKDGGDENAVARRLLCSDVTIERMAEILAANPRGVLLARDELAAWIGSFTRYRGQGGSDCPHWLEIHRAGSIVVDRKGDERRTTYVPQAAVSVIGGIQPGILQRAMTREFLESGLMARILMARPPRQQKTWSEVELDPHTEHAYEDILDKLLALDFEMKDGEPRPHVFKLSDEAKRRFVTFYDQWAAHQAKAEGAMAATLSKLEGTAARLALVHHIVSTLDPPGQECRPISGFSMAAAITLTRWFANEAQLIYGEMGEGAEEEEQQALVELIARRQDSRISVRQLQRANSRKYPDKMEAQAALDALAHAELGTWEEGPKPAKGGHQERFLKVRPTHDSSDSRPGQDTDLTAGLSDTLSGTR